MHGGHGWPLSVPMAQDRAGVSPCGRPNTLLLKAVVISVFDRNGHRVAVPAIAGSRDARVTPPAGAAALPSG